MRAQGLLLDGRNSEADSNDVMNNPGLQINIMPLEANAVGLFEASLPE